MTKLDGGLWASLTQIVKRDFMNNDFSNCDFKK